MRGREGDSYSPDKDEICPEHMLWAYVLSTFSDDIKYYFNFIYAVKYSKTHKLPPKDYNKVNHNRRVYDIYAIIAALNLEWTECICDLANVDYEWFKELNYKLIKELDTHGRIKLQR